MFATQNLDIESSSALVALHTRIGILSHKTFIRTDISKVMHAINHTPANERSRKTNKKGERERERKKERADVKRVDIVTMIETCGQADSE